MDMKAFSEKNRERCESSNGFGHSLAGWSLSDWMTATFGELGEAANVAKKLNRVRDGITGNKETEAELREKFGRELADTFVYLDLTAQAAGIDLPAKVVEVFNAKSEQIGSPIRFPVGSLADHDPQFLANFFGNLSLLLACLRNHAAGGAAVDLNAANELAKEVAAGLEKFNHFFRELA